MSLEIIDKCPTCGSERIRQGSKEKALVAWGINGTGIIVEITQHGALSNEKVDIVSDWADEVFPEVDGVKEGMSIWEGVVIINEEGERLCRGQFRKLTMEEWETLKSGKTLWNH